MNSTVKDYYRLHWTGNGDLSEDGRYLVYTDTHFNEPDEEVNELYLLDRNTGTKEIIGHGTDPLFTADQKYIFYLCKDAEGLKQLFSFDLVTTETEQLTRMRYGVASFVLSHHGHHAAFTSNIETDCPVEKLASEADEKEKAEDALRKQQKPYVEITDFGYKNDAYGGFSGKHCWSLWHLHEGDQPVMLSDGDRDHVMPAFRMDDASLLFVSNRDRSREESIAMDLYEVSLHDHKITRLTSEEWIAYYPAPFQPVVLPDDSIVYGALESTGIAGEMPLTRLYHLGKDGKKAALWPANAPCHEATCFLYNCENEGLGTRKTAVEDSTATSLFFISGWHGACNLYRADTEKAEITPVTKETAAYRSIQRSGKQYLLSKGDFTHVPQLYLADEDMMLGKKAWNPLQLTDGNEWLASYASQPEEMWIDSLDGEGRIQGFVFPPQNREEGKKYPAVVYIHGGPTPFMGAAMNYEHQCITGAGMGLIIMNFRGSSGYGSSFQSMKKAFDGTAMTDILQFTRAAVETYDWIDGGRLGVTGGSYGGYMTNWITSHAKVFKAAVTQRSIASDVIEYASSDMAESSVNYESMSDFIKDKLKTSAAAYAENIDIPFLILHGMNDMRTPVEQAHQLFSAVKECHPDLPVKMILYPGMNHEFPMSGPMDLRIHHYNAMIQWFEKYL